MFIIVRSVARWLSHNGKLVFCIGALVGTVAFVLFVNRGHDAKADAKAKEKELPPPLRMRKQLVDQVAAEPVDSLLDNLTSHLDDIASAEIGANLSMGDGQPGCYLYGCVVVPRLVRVRRLLQEVPRQDRKTLRPKLEKMLTDAVHDYFRFYKEYDKEHFQRCMKPEEAPFNPPKQMEYFRRTVNANVSTYLLAEFKCFESLPVMSRTFERQSPRFPISRLFVYYSMHVLALEHPRDGLSPEALIALDAYLAATRDKIPSPIVMSRPAWNATIDEGDFRVTILGQTNLTKKVPQIRVREYPGKFSQLENTGEIVGRSDHGLSREVFVWHGLLSEFIALAYPRAGIDDETGGASGERRKTTQK